MDSRSRQVVTGCPTDHKDIFSCSQVLRLLTSHPLKSTAMTSELNSTGHILLVFPEEIEKDWSGSLETIPDSPKQLLGKEQVS